MDTHLVWPNPHYIARRGMFDHFEIHPVVEVDPDNGAERYIEQVTGPETTEGVNVVRSFFTLYGHSRGEGVEALADFDELDVAINTVERMGIYKPDIDAETMDGLLAQVQAQHTAGLLNLPELRLPEGQIAESCHRRLILSLLWCAVVERDDAKSDAAVELAEASMIERHGELDGRCILAAMLGAIGRFNNADRLPSANELDSPGTPA